MRLLFFFVFSLSLFFRGGGAVFHLHGIRVMPLGNLWLLPSGLLIFFFHLLFSFLPSPLSGASAPALRALLHKFARPTKSVTVRTLRVPYDSAESSGLNQVPSIRYESGLDPTRQLSCPSLRADLDSADSFTRVPIAIGNGLSK